MTIRCCYGCTERTVTCHSTCGKYKAESDALKERNAMIYKQKSGEKIADNYFRDSKPKKLKKYYRGKK